MFRKNNYKVQKVYFFVMWYINLQDAWTVNPINHHNVEHSVVSAERRNFSFFLSSSSFFSIIIITLGSVYIYIYNHG
jgi:hypothetical protein